MWKLSQKNIKELRLNRGGMLTNEDSSDIEEMHLYSKSSEPSRNENLPRLSSLLCAARQLNLFSFKQVIKNKTKRRHD